MYLNLSALQHYFYAPTIIHHNEKFHILPPERILYSDC